MSNLRKQAAAAVKAGKVADQTEDTGGTFERVVAPKGKCLAVLVNYIELGLRDGGEYLGKKKPNARQARLVFELSGKKHTRVIGEGETERTVRNTIGFNIAIKTGDRANFRKLFKKMDYGRGLTHMSEMLGETFLVDVKHREVEKDGKTVTYANLKDEDGYHIGAPVRTIPDPDDEDGFIERVVTAPEPFEQDRLLLWDSPTIEQWDSLFIDGTYTRKEGDKEVEVSKNWIQNMLMEALDYEESALATLLGTAEIPGLDGGEGDVAPTTTEDDEPPVSDDPAASGGDVDPLADLSDLDDEIPF